MRTPEIVSSHFSSTMSYPEDDIDISYSDDMDGYEIMLRDDDTYAFEDTRSDDDMDNRDKIKIKMVQIKPVLSYTEIEIMDPVFITETRRDGRKNDAELFRREYTYGPSKELKTCIWSNGVTHSWLGKSSGIIWVGVLGMNSACVVTRTGYLDVARAHGSYKYKTKEMVLRYFREAAISEMEDLEEPSSELCKKLGQSFKRPFGVVSGIPCIDEVDTECGHEASGDEYESYEYDSDDSMWKRLFEEANSRQAPSPPEYDVTKTIGFLQQKLKSNPTSTVHETVEASSVECDEKTAVEFLKGMSLDATFTVDETIQIAISAFQHLFQKKFEANEIEVSVTYPDYWITWEEAQYQDKNDSIKELEMSDIENHLAVINEPGSGSLSSG